MWYLNTASFWVKDGFICAYKFWVDFGSPSSTVQLEMRAHFIFSQSKPSLVNTKNI